MRVVLLQVGCALATGAVFWPWQGAAAARSALAGGLIVAAGSGIFGWRLFAPGIAPAAVLRRALFAAESLKLFWYVLCIWSAFAWLKMPALPLLSGLVFAQFGHWFALLSKRGKSNGSV